MTTSKLFKIACACALFVCVKSAVVISPTNEHIIWNGRWAEEASSSTRSAGWSLTGVTIKCTGTSYVSFHIKDKETSVKSYYVVEVDSEERYSGPNSDDGFIVKELDPAETYVVRLIKRGEMSHGPNILVGIELSDGGELVEYKYPYSHRIEFIGDSITCGYGALGLNYSCHYSITNSDATKSYSFLTATRFNAEIYSECWSGKGLLRNYGDTKWRSDDNMVDDYEYTIHSEGVPSWDAKWNHSNYHPDLIVINLGTNDYSVNSSYVPSDDQFKTAYVNFMTSLLKNSPEAHVIAACSTVTTCCKNTEAAVKELAATGNKVHYVHLPTLDYNTDYGCDWHPNFNGHRKYADTIIKYVEENLGWN